MKKLFGSLAAMALLWTSGAAGQTGGDWERLPKADTEARDLLASNRAEDARKAMALLKGAGIESLVAPSDTIPLPEPTQAEALEHFGRAALATRDDLDQGLRAARRLQALRPDYPFAYRLELELIAATPRGTWTNERRSYAKRAYDRYVESRKSKPAIRSPISDPAEELVFSDYPADVCEFVAKMEEQGRRSELEQYLNPEPLPEEAPATKVRSLVEGGTEFGEGAVYSITRVDVDGDGLGDLLVKTVQGTAGCNYWWAYKRTKGKALSGPLLFSFGENAFCGTSMSFIRHRGRNYVYEDAGQGIAEVMDPAKIATFSDMTTLCKLAYEYRYEGAKVDANCKEGACGEIAKMAPEIAASPSSMRMGKEVEGDFGTYLDSAYELDLANDGSKVVFGTWYKGPWNPWLTFLRQPAPGKYQEFNPSEQWAGYDQISGVGFNDPVLGHTFVRVGDKNYWIITTQAANRERNLEIFVIESSKVRRVGNVTVGNMPVKVQVRGE